MRSAFVLGLVTLAIGCGSADRSSATLAAMAGTWQVRGLDAAGDSIISYRVTGGTETSGWTVQLPGRDPMVARVVAVQGDSVVTESGPFESALRPGVQVTTRSTFRLSGDSLVGSVVAHYSGGGPDSVINFRLIGVRAATP
jgi:hypothetical protein